jgi:hypothetical protein
VDGPICGDALRASGTQSILSNNPGGLGNPQETFPRSKTMGRGSSETIRAGTVMSKI